MRWTRLSFSQDAVGMMLIPKVTYDFSAYYLSRLSEFNYAIKLIRKFSDI